MEEKKQVTVSMNLGMALLIGVALGILLLIIGAATDTSGSVYAGLIITPLALFAGGFLMKEENNVVRLGMLLAGALFFVYVAAVALGQAISGSPF